MALATWAFVGLGIGLRVAAYSLNFPLWWDEAFVAVNFLKRDYLGLVGPLDYGQVCPLLFLWAELAAIRVFGFAEWSLRLFPLGCAVASVVGFRLMAGRLVAGRTLLVVVAIFAVSVHPIRHAADLKPYASDLLAALVLQWLALGWLREPSRSGWLGGLAVVGPLVLLVSHPGPLVAGGVGLALAVPAWRSRRWIVRTAWGVYGLGIGSTFVLLYLWFTRAQAGAASPGMREMWVRSFPPLDSVTGLIGWLVTVHTGDMLAYPCGGERGASSVSLLLAVVGAAVLWRGGRRASLAVLVAPLGLGMVVAGLGRYPYGGPAPHGSAARIMQYAAPGLCLLIGLGAASVQGLVRSVGLRDRLLRVVLALLVVVGLVPVVAGLRHPYRAFQAEAAREFARRFWPEIAQGAEVACLRWDFPGVAEWDSVHLGIAVMLCDQAIYSPSRRAGGPRWDRVTRDHPLRCVLGVAPERDTPEVVAWLARMEWRYQLRRRDTRFFDAAEPGRPPHQERFEVFEFVPRVPPGQSPIP